MTQKPTDWDVLNLQLRAGLNLCILGGVIVNVFAILIKLLDCFPDHMTWLGVFVAPNAYLLLFTSIFFCPLLLRERWWLLFLPIAILCNGAVLALLLLRGVNC